MERSKLKENEIVFIVNHKKDAFTRDASYINAIEGRVIRELENTSEEEVGTDYYQVLGSDGHEYFIYYPATYANIFMVNRLDYYEKLQEIRERDIEEMNEIRDHLSKVFGKMDEVRMQCKNNNHILTDWEETSWLVYDPFSPNKRRVEHGWQRNCKCCAYEEKSFTKPNELNMKEEQRRL